MAASALDRTQPAPRTSGFADLADLGPAIERDAEPEDRPVAPSPTTHEAAPAPSGGLADLAGLGATIEREEPEEPAAYTGPAVEAPPAPPSPSAPAPSGGLADLAGLGATIERDSPTGDEEASVAAAPSAPPAPPAAIVPRTSRPAPREPVAAPPAASTGSEPDLNLILQQSGRDLTAARAGGLDAPGTDGIDAGYPALPSEDGTSPEGNDPDKDEEGKSLESQAPVAEVMPLRPTDELDPDAAFFGMGHAAQVIEAALRGMPADPSTLELARRWQEIDGAHSQRYRQATEEFQRHKALEDMRAPVAAGPGEGGQGGRGRGGGLSSIARGLANMGRRGVEAKRRAATRSAGQELDQIRDEYEGDATDFIRNLFSFKSRHYADRLHEMGQQHGSLNDAIARYNRAFAGSAAAAPFLDAVEAYGRDQGLSKDDALAAAASGKAGPQVAAALASVKGATLADPAVDAARAGMREAEEAFTDTARRAQKDFESLLRFSTPDDGFDAEKTSEDLIAKMNGLADATKDPIAEDEDKAKMAERMRELADSIQRMIREMFEKMFRAVTGAFGR